MARIRSIHPGLCTDEAYMEMSIEAKAAWPTFWTVADDRGAFDWKPKSIKAAILPADNVDMIAILEEWKSLGVIRAVEIDGKPCGLVKNFCRFQSPKFPSYRYELTEDMLKYVRWTPKKTGKGSSSTDGDSGMDTGEDEDQPEPIPPHIQKLSGSTAVALPPGEERRGEERKGEEVRSLRSLTAGERFEEFWRLYPRKDAPGDARRALTIALTKTDLPTIIAAIANADWGDNPRFIPAPAKWLEGERWLDKPPSAPDATSLALPRPSASDALAGMDGFHFDRWQSAKAQGFPVSMFSGPDKDLPPEEREQRMLSSLETIAPAAYQRIVRNSRN